MLEGYKTILFNFTALVAAIAGNYGFIITVETQTAIVMGIMAVAGIVLRAVTTTPVGPKVPFIGQ